MTKRIKNLDLFRFLAIALVIYIHVATRFLSNIITDSAVLGMGKYGVEMFFVLSGFLIANLYYKKSVNKNLFRFWLERFFRTYPPYIVALLASYGVVYVSRKEPFDYFFLFFVQNFYNKIPFFLASWSLCVEEHFYLAFPLIILFSNKVLKQRHLKLVSWIFLVIAPSFIRYYWGDSHNTTWGYYVTATIFRFDGISLGCLLAFVLTHYNVRIKSNVFISLLLLITFLGLSYYQAAVKSSFNYSIGYLLLILNAGALLLSFYFSDEFYVSKFGFVQKGALMAYSFYLTHNLVLNLAEALLKRGRINNPFASLTITMASIIVVGLIFYYLIEKKSIEFRNRILK